MALLSLLEDLNDNRRRGWRKRQRYPLIELMDQLTDFGSFPYVISINEVNGKRRKLADDKDDCGFSLELEETKGFSPEELTVKVKGREVEISGKHEEKDDEAKNYVYREFKRSFQLPEDADPESIVSELSRDGLLIIRASPLHKEKTIKIAVEREKNEKTTSEE